MACASLSSASFSQVTGISKHVLPANSQATPCKAGARRNLRLTCSASPNSVNAQASHRPEPETITNPCAPFAVRSIVAAASAAVLFAAPFQFPALAEDFQTYYGTAASASSYGGYGGNASKKDTAEYIYEVPADWKERAISKVEKGTNGTDSEFYNPKKRREKTYTLYLAGFRRLPAKENVLDNIALSDVDLQDLLASAESTSFTERKEEGQVYYEFDIDSPVGHALITVTTAKNKLYAHFVNAPPADWSKDEAVLRKIHTSFKTIGVDPLGS